MCGGGSSLFCSNLSQRYVDRPSVNIDAIAVGARSNYGLRSVGSSGLAGSLTDNSRNGVFQLYVGFGL
jgi:hypothetical protein